MGGARGWWVMRLVRDGSAMRGNRWGRIMAGARTQGALSEEARLVAARLGIARLGVTRLRVARLGVDPQARH